MTTVTHVEPAKVSKSHLVPVAMIDMSVPEFSEACGITFRHEKDDLDEYFALYLDISGTPAALKRYNGEPPKGITIYLESTLAEKAADRIIGKILKHYNLTKDRISWRDSLPVTVGDSSSA